MRPFALLGAFVLLVGCTGGTAPQAAPPGAGDDAGSPDVDGGAAPPVTTANPPGETHVGALSVTLTSVPAATIKYTMDGSDPTTSSTAVSGTSPVVLTLDAPSQVTLTFFAVGTDGPSEVPHSEQYSIVENLNPASISGRLFVPAAMLSGSADVVLYSVDPRSSGARNHIVGVQTVSPQAGGAPYHFDGLAAGRYWVAAGWWPSTPSGDPVAYGVARLSPSSVDPAITANSRVDFVDVYVGECDPQDSGVDGTVTLSSDLASDVAVVAAFASQPTPATLQGTPIGYVAAVGTGTTRPFAMCGLGPGSVYVMAGAGTSMSRPGSGAGVYAAYPSNPVSATHVAHISLSIGEQETGLGSISGTVHLNGGLPDGSITIAVTAHDSGNIVQEAVQGFVGIDGTAGKDYAYAVNNLPAGTYDVALDLKTADMPALEALFQAPQPVTISIPGNANVALDLTGSVGRVDGTLTLTNPPSSGLRAAVAATPIGASTPAGAKAVTLAPGSGGSETADFTIFGLPDGTFSVGALIDSNNNSDFSDDLRNGCGAVAPSPATISQGSTVTKDVTVTLTGAHCP